MPSAGDNDLSALSKDPQALVRVPIGAASPLWGLFAGAAMTGAAWWWMTRWARPANLEALFGAAETATTEAAATVRALATPAVEAMREAPTVVQSVLDATAEAVEAAPAVVAPAMEAAAEKTKGKDAPVLPAAGELIEAAPKAVGGESAPISPVVEARSPEVSARAHESKAPVRTANEAAAKVTPLPKPKKSAARKAD